MALLTRTIILSRFCVVALLLVNASVATAKSVRVPAHVFPDKDSDIITYMEIDPGASPDFPRVLDASLGDTWYWSTYEGEFIGYVNKREVLSRNQLKEGTLIRTNPTYRSWVLTRYQRGDLVNVRSRLSVGRVSFNKEIPVYFQLPQTAPVATTPEPASSREPPSPPSLPQHEDGEAQSEESMPDDAIAVEESLPPASDAEKTPAEPAARDTRLDLIPERAESFEPEPEPIDPLLEEQPRIPAQDLANLAPPPAALFQEFEGYLRIVPEDDAMSRQFQYQLETRSGQRIVYVRIDQLRRDSYREFVNEWINIRGTLDEVGDDFTLFIDARSIWIAPTP